MIPNVVENMDQPLCQEKEQQHLFNDLYSPRSGSGRSCAWPRCTGTPGRSRSRRRRNGCPALWCQTLTPPSLRSQDHFHSTRTGAGRYWMSGVHCPKEKIFRDLHKSAGYAVRWRNHFASGSCAQKRALLCGLEINLANLEEKAKWGSTKHLVTESCYGSPCPPAHRTEKYELHNPKVSFKTQQIFFCS